MAVHTFGLMLKRHRLAGGMTQEELAGRTGVSVRAIGDLERGLRQPRKDTLQILLDTLQLAPDEAEAVLAEEGRSFKPSIGHQREAFHIEARTDTA